MRRGALQYCVMSLLATRERYGFELVQDLARADGMVMGEGTIYPLLARLRREGLVETTWQESASGPPRRYYRLTTDGHQALGVFTEEWRRFRTTVDDLLESRPGV